MMTLSSCKKISMALTFPVACHTDNVGPGTIFVAIKGAAYDGTLYIPQAIARGASKIVIQQDVDLSPDIIRLMCDHGIVVCRVDNTRKALGQLSAQIAGYPAQKLKIIGVTGTKGKTTSIYILEALLKQLGKKVARLSTVSNTINGCELNATLTTAQPDYLHQFFALCVTEGVEYVVMEIAAQATTFNRLETLEFSGLIFTNLDREHAELYPEMADYFQAKAAIFDYLDPHAPCVVNADDVYGQRIIQERVNAIGFSCKDNVLQASVCVSSDNETITIAYECIKKTFSYTGLRGLFNMYNLAGALIVLDQLGLSLNHFLENPIIIPKVPGRLEEYLLPNGAYAYIDYAHTPGSFTNLLSVVRAWTDNLIVVFGAGGGKDPIKRPLMGSIAAQFADLVIVTTDNPRQEDPQKIIADILIGIDQSQGKVLVELDRKKAIEMAYQYSKKGSIIMLLGKGPDEYQIVGTQKIPFSEKRILQSFFK